MLGLVGLVIPMALLATAVVIFLVFFRSSMIMPGVRVLSQDLGGQSTAEATALLQQSWQGRRIALVDPAGTTRPVILETLGLSLDPAATARLAHEQSRSPSTWLQIIRGKGHVDIVPAWRLDVSLAEASLRGLAPHLQVPAVNAGLRAHAGQVEQTPSQPGYSLDVAATLARLEQNTSQILADGRLHLVMVSVQPVIGETGPALAEAQALLAAPPAMAAYDPITGEKLNWSPTPAEWSDWLLLGVEPGDPVRLTWSLDGERIKTFLSTRAAALGSDRYLNLDEAAAGLSGAVRPSELLIRVYHREQQHTIRSGETLSSIAYDYGLPYPWLQQANPGAGDALSPGQVITIPSPDVLLPLPVVYDKRIVVSLSQQRLWAYENGAVKWEWTVSTGIPSSPTSPGVFQVQSHELDAYAANWDLWMPHFMGIYRPVPTSDFMNGFHGFPTRSGSTLLWTGDLGHPVTYGCILVSSDNAALLYDWAETGVVVEIQK